MPTLTCGYRPKTNMRLTAARHLQNRAREKTTENVSWLLELEKWCGYLVQTEKRKEFKSKNKVYKTFERKEEFTMDQLDKYDAQPDDCDSKSDKDEGKTYSLLRRELYYIL